VDVKAIEDDTVAKAKIFLTENSNQPAELQMNRSMVENTTTTAPNSVFDAGMSRLTAMAGR
jgi:hypothetical protein